MRSSIIGNSYTAPIIDRHLELGTWQHVILIDFDKVSSSNLNRQLLYNLSSVGNLKIDEAKKYALSINEDVDITLINLKVDEDNIKELEDEKKIIFEICLSLLLLYKQDIYKEEMYYV
mgnify:CR=1 FL=1